ncbi:MAG TPA: hypothetical protein VEB42_03990 [Chitinophagaceae bacterium]|nr:hypothetical protein [Chitinophagaceae bacterium]
MSELIMAIVLTLLQFATGFGVLGKFRIQLKPAMHISLSVLLGVAIFSIVPFVLQLLFVPLTADNVFLALAITCVLLNVRSAARIRQLGQILKEAKFRITLYDIPFLLVIAFIVFVSVWRCFYFPPTSRDLTSGAEVIAEYAVREKTMINSVFSLHLESMNNHFKSPFIISLQVIYKYAGFPFGQVWLCNVFICFVVFLYHALGLTLHRWLAGILMVCFLAIPEMYAYTFMVLYDYSNAAFFFLAAYFMIEFFKAGKKNYIAFAGFLMAIATYVRSETLVLGGMLSLAIILHYTRNRDKFFKPVIAGLRFLLPAMIVYFVMVNIYIDHYLPIRYDIEGLVNNSLFNLRPLWHRLIDINTELIFSSQGITYYGYFFFIFLAIFLADVLRMNISAAAKNWAYAVLVVYFGLALLGFLLPLLDLDNSTKRGLFKIFPLMLLYLANSSLLKDLSSKITAWENARH